MIIFRPKVDPNLKRDPILVQSFIEWFERNSHAGGQSDPLKGKSLKGLEESWQCEGEFMLNWKGRGFKTILDVLLVCKIKILFYVSHCIPLIAG